MSSFILKSKAPTSLMGAAKIVCEAQLFFAKTLAILGINQQQCFVWQPHYVRMVEH